MKKIIILSLAVFIFVGCFKSEDDIMVDLSQNEENVDVQGNVDDLNNDTKYVDWLIGDLSDRFEKEGFLIEDKIYSLIGGDDAEVIGFDKSNISVIIFDNDHSILGNSKQFEESIASYSSDEFYGEIILNDKQVNSDVLLQYTGVPVMANHGAMKNEYFFTLKDNSIVKVVVTFPAESELSSEGEVGLMQDDINDIHELLLLDF